jgi:hypothetical protein
MSKSVGFWCGVMRMWMCFDTNDSIIVGISGDKK